MRQPDGSDPTPTQPLLQLVARQMLIENPRQSQAHHELDQEHKVVNPFTDEREFVFHALIVSGNSAFE